jgi:hypothetical protein
LHEPFLEWSLTGFNVPGSWFKVGKTLKIKQCEEQTSLNEFQNTDRFKDFGALSRAVPALLLYPKTMHLRD